MKKFYSLILIGLLTGCSGVHQIGSIGQNKLHNIHGRSLDGPNYMGLAEEHPDGTVSYIFFTSGPGIGQAVVGAGGNVAAAAVLRPARNTTNVAATGGSGEVSASASSSSTGSTGSTTNNGAHDNQNGNSGH